MRPWGRRGDAAALAVGWADPDVQRWTAVPTDRSVKAAARWIRGADERERSNRSVDRVIHAPDDEDEVWGEVGFVVVQSDCPLPARTDAEVGWWLLPEARGRGHAAAALSSFTDYVSWDFPGTRLFARTEPDNPAAGCVAARAGWRDAGVADGRRLWTTTRQRWH